MGASGREGPAVLKSRQGVVGLQGPGGPKGARVWKCERLHISYA